MATPASVTPPEDQFARRLRAAKWLAKQGFGIVSVPTPTPGDCGCPPKSSTRQNGGPCKSAGKHPLGQDWEHHAAHTPEEVEALTKPHLQPLRQFGAFPEPGSRLLVLDEDRAGTLLAICDEYKVSAPDTFMVLTSRDATTGERKRHYYFRLPDGYDESSVPKTWIGGEIRVAGSGHVVAPWSKHASGLVYEATGIAEIATIPADLIDALRKTVGVRQAAQTVAQRPGDPGYILHTGEGRHEFLVQTGRHLWKGGLRGLELVERLVKVDAERCDPPYGRPEMERLAAWCEQNLDEPWVPMVLNVPGATRTTSTGQVIHVVSDGDPDFADEVPVGFPDDPHPVAFSGLAGEIVDDLAAITSASRTGLLVTALTFWGGLFGDRFHLYEEQPTNIFAVLVGDTARGRKGTATRSVWAAFQEALDPTAAIAKVNKLDNSNWGGLASGQGLLRTMQGAGEVKRGVSIEEEFESVLRGARSTRDYNSVLNTIINKAWDGNLIRHTTASQTTSFLIEPPYTLGMLGNITREVMRGLLPPELVTGGFANRLLWVPVRGRDGAVRANVPMRLSPEVREALIEARDWRLSQGSATYKTPIFTDPAADLVQEYYDHLGTTGGGYNKFTPRFHVMAARLAFIHALMDRSPKVDVAYVQRGIALTEYARSALPWCFSAETGDDRVDYLIDLLRTKPEGITARQYAQVYKDGGVQQRVRRLALAAGLIEIVNGATTAKGGRPAKIMRLSPLVLEGIADRFERGFVVLPTRARGNAVTERTGKEETPRDEVGTEGIWTEIEPNNPPTIPSTNPSPTPNLAHKLVCLFYSDHQTIHLRHTCGSFHCEACSPVTEECP